MRTVSTSPAVGVEIEVISICATQSMTSLLRSSGISTASRTLLIFRNQMLDGPQQVEVTGIFRTDAQSPRKGQSMGLCFTNVLPDGLVPEWCLAFHYDFAFTDEPVWGISLFALEVTDDAPTWFISSTRAAAALSPEIRKRLSGRRRC